MKNHRFRSVAALSLAIGLAAGVGVSSANAATIPQIQASAVLAPVAAVSASLITVNQNVTGAQAAYNCGPSSVVIALKSVGKTPRNYASGGVKAVQKVRSEIGHGGVTDLAELEKVIKTYGVKTARVKYAARVTAAGQGKTVILHTNLYGGHYVVAKGKDSSGRIRVSDPAGGKIYYKTVKQLNDIKRSFDRATIVG